MENISGLIVMDMQLTKERGENMLSAKQLSEKLNISIKTIYKYVRQGMPHVKLKGKTSAYRFELEKVMEWLGK